MILFLFFIGYLFILSENFIRLNKAASALLFGVLCWAWLAINPSLSASPVMDALAAKTADIAGLVFFLLGAMTIVELIDAHDGFEIITSFLKITNKRTLLWAICLLAFFLSAVLDNLTTTIVLVTIIRNLLKNEKDKNIFIGMVVIAANAGGVWSPIGDVTTTMLWMSERVTSLQLIIYLFIPSLLSIVVPLAIISFSIKGKMTFGETEKNSNSTTQEKWLVLLIGFAALISVPIFKTLTHLPPYMVMLLALGVVWLITEIIHRRKVAADKHPLSVEYAIRKIDSPSILFFIGILLSVAALEQSGWLHTLTTSLFKYLKSETMIASAMGIISAVIDNVPLVAAGISMFDVTRFPTDHSFWHLLAFTTGTGGSMLIIGSAAGVAAMGMENISFGYYLKKISWLAAIGFVVGIGWLIIF